MKFCPQCGTELNPESKFCASCGAGVPPSIPDTQQVPLSSQGQSGYKDEKSDFIQATEVFTAALTGKTNLMDRVKNILLNPKQEWTVILTEQPKTKKIIFGYVSILALIPALSVILGYGLHGYWMTGIQEGLVQFLVSVISVLIIAWIVDLLAPSFQSEVNFVRSLQLVAYSLTPGLTAGILLLIPSFSPFVLLISLYSIYLMYTGIPLLKKTPVESVAGYVGITIVVIILLSLILAFVLAGVVAFLLFR